MGKGGVGGCSGAIFSPGSERHPPPAQPGPCSPVPISWAVCESLLLLRPPPPSPASQQADSSRPARAERRRGLEGPAVFSLHSARRRVSRGAKVRSRRLPRARPLPAALRKGFETPQPPPPHPTPAGWPKLRPSSLRTPDPVLCPHSGEHQLWKRICMCAGTTMCDILSSIPCSSNLVMPCKIQCGFL